MEKEVDLIDENLLKSKIYTIRGVKVMLDADLAEIYGYSTKAFNQQVKNNIEKFPDDFRFQLDREEYRKILGSKFLTLEQGKYSKSSPYVFTEQGVYMIKQDLFCKFMFKKQIFPPLSRLSTLFLPSIPRAVPSATIL